MQIKTIKQCLGRTIQFSDESYLKFSVEQEAEIGENEDPKKCQEELFLACKEQMNNQTKIMLKK